MIGWSAVSIACCLMALVFAVYAFKHVSLLIIIIIIIIIILTVPCM